MEMKEVYPKLPSAPPEGQGQGYRLQKINEVQAFLEKEVATRVALTLSQTSPGFYVSPPEVF